MVGVWIIEQKVPYLVVLPLLEISSVVPWKCRSNSVRCCDAHILGQSLSEDNTKSKKVLDKAILFATMTIVSMKRL